MREAADELAKSGRKATVIDAYSMPLNTQGVLDVAARSGGRVVTVETGRCLSERKL